MIEVKDQDRLKQYLFERIKWVPSPYGRTIGSVDETGRILGVVGYDNWNKASCTMDIAGEPGWLTKGFIRVAFDYPFNKLGCRVVISSIASTNVKSLDINARLGFETVGIIRNAHPDGDIIIRALQKDQCRWLKI